MNIQLWGHLQKTWEDLTKGWRDGRNVPSVGADLPKNDARRVHDLMEECLSGRGGEVTARHRAALLGQVYMTLNDEGRNRFLEILVKDFPVERERVKETASQLLEAVDEVTFNRVSADLADALISPQRVLLQQFNDLPQGVKFLIDLRADLLRYLKQNPCLEILDFELRRLLATWFDVGFLEITRIDWQSPAALLEKLVDYEAVHAIRSWEDLRHRLESDRRCYAFFHPAMPEEPLIFIEVALVEGLAVSVQALLDREAPDMSPEDADTAIFYSISNTQKGLQGISFGPFLIKQVVDRLHRELPNLKVFSTLSPLPGFRRWLDMNIASGSLLDEADPVGEVLEEAAQALGVAPELDRIIDHPRWWSLPEVEALLKEPLLVLAARYLHDRRDKDRAPLDPVARFHLGNGARVEQVNWLGDISSKGMRESCGLMVNYLYHLKDIEKNIEAYAVDKQIASASRIRNLMRENVSEESRLGRLQRLLSLSKTSAAPENGSD